MIRLLRNPIALAVLAVVLLIVLASTVSIVPETKQAVIVRFGEPVRVVNRYQDGARFGYGGAGLVFRIPFVEQIHWIDRRVLSLEMDNQPVLSTDQLRLEVDAFARFRIKDPLQMYIAAGTEENLVNQLKPILASALRNEFGRRPSAALLTPERGQMMGNIRNALNRVAAQYGAEIVDVRISAPTCPPAPRSIRPISGCGRTGSRRRPRSRRRATARRRSSVPKRTPRRLLPMRRRSTAMRSSTISTAPCSPTSRPSSAAGKDSAAGRASSCRRTTIICVNSAVGAE